MKPVDITANNTPIPPNYDGQSGKEVCACGGKGCKTKKPADNNGEKGACGPLNCACGPECKCMKQGCCKSLLSIVVAFIIAGGVAMAGWAIGCGIHQISASQRSIAVRGFSERDVVADLAIWNIGYVATGNELADVQAKIETDGETIRSFLKQNGIKDEEIMELPTSMTDLMSRDYRSEGASQSRYIVNAGLRVRSANVDVVRALSGVKIGALIKSGVTLKEGQPPVYVYTKLKDVKPAMVAEATDDARKAAEQFAKDSGAKLGGMKGATQGVFQFLPRDQADGVVESYEINKTVRVVTTVNYFLRD